MSKDREESVCCFFSQFREATQLSESFHIIGFHITGTSLFYQWLFPRWWKESSVYFCFRICCAANIVSKESWGGTERKYAKKMLRKIFFSGKAFYLNPFRQWALSHEVGNHFLVNEVPQMEYGHTATHIWWHLWTEVAFLNVYVEFYWVLVLWVKQSLSGWYDCLSKGHLPYLVVWKCKCVWRRK